LPLGGRATQLTTEAYRKAAAQVLINAVNRMSGELGLREKASLDPDGYKEILVQAPYWSLQHGWFGTVRTTDYLFAASQENKLSSVDYIQASAKDYLEWVRRHYATPKSELNNGAAFSLATNWLNAVGVDVAAIQRECKVEFHVQSLGDKFVPIYWITWRQPTACFGCPPGKLGGESAAAVSVRVLEPERKLLQLEVNNPRYLLRKSLAVEDSDGLLQQTDDLEVRRYWLSTPAYREGALRVMLSEVNWARKQLDLAGGKTLEASNLTHIAIATPYVTDVQGHFATISDKEYVYCATSSNKLSWIARNFNTLDELNYYAFLKSNYSLPIWKVDTNSAYLVARKYLEAVSVDVAGMESEFPAAANPWILGTQFVPIYEVVWSRLEDSREVVAAAVEVVQPTGVLKSLIVRDARYLRRPGLQVSDREALLTGTNAVPQPNNHSVR